jgi:hypothetical protein
MGTRLKGQETAVSFVSANGTEESVADVKSFDIQFDRDILSEGYLGQTTEQKDDIFKGVSGKLEFHVREAEFLDLVQRMNNATKRRLPGEQFEIVSTLTFPDGKRRRILVADAKFGGIPISIPSRDDYVSVTFDYAADDGAILAA